MYTVIKESQTLRFPQILNTIRSINKFWFKGYKPYFCKPFLVLITSGNSSFGRARPCQGRGGRFEPGFPLQKIKKAVINLLFLFIVFTRVVELVDTQDLKSCGQQWPCGFNSHPGYYTAFLSGFFLLKIRDKASFLYSIEKLSK